VPARDLECVEQFRPASEEMKALQRQAQAIVGEKAA